MRVSLLSLLILLTLIAPLVTPVAATITDTDFPEARVFVTEVVDGDTIRIAPALKVAGQYRDTVRLADINAPELGTPEGDQAKNALTQLLASYGGVVYLDIDDMNGVDGYGRIVAVVYVRYNSTHLLNVNKWLVDNGYAQIDDFNDEFDPSDWSLYEQYPSSSDNYPTVNDYTVTGYNPDNPTSHGGVSYAVTPDGSYVAFAVAEQYDKSNNPTPKVRVMIFNTATGGLEANITIDQAYNTTTNAFQGFIAIAANSTGFLVVWNQFSDTVGGTSRSRIVEWAYIGKTGSGWQVITKGYSYSGSYQYAPMAAYIPSVGNWSVFYVYSTSAGLNRLYVNTHTGWLEVPGSTAGSADLNLTTAGSPMAVGVDYYGRLFMDPHSGKIAVVARTWSSSTGYDMGVVVFTPSTSQWGVSVVPIDNRNGDQGPSPISYTSGGTTYYYSALFGNVHSAALDTGSSTRILAVYNDTSTSLAYFVYDVTTGQTVREPTTLASRLRDGYSYYPWVIAGRNGWLVIYSDGYGNYNYTYIDINGSIVLSSPVPLGNNIGWVRGTFDPDSGRFIIVFSSRGPKSDRDIFLVYVDESTKELSKYVVPVAATDSDEFFTLPVYLNGRLYLAYIGGSTYVAVVEPGFYEPPIPIPEPWITGAVALAVAVTVIAFYISRRKH